MQPDCAIPSVSILIPVLNEIRHLPALLESVSLQTYPKDKIQVILLDGGSTDGSIDWLRENAFRFPFAIKIVDNPDRYQSPGLNLGLKQAAGELVIRMDAHAVYDQNYVATAVRILTTRQDVMNVGGTQVAVGTRPFSKAAALAMNSPLGVGGATFRYAKTAQPADSVFLGAWHRADLLEVGGWNVDWVINEDAELNLRLKRAHPERILLVTPDMRVHYHPRSSLGALAKQYYRYGLWRLKTFNHYPEAMRLSHVVPVILVLGLAVACLLGLLTKLWWFWALPLAYLLGLVLAAFSMAVRNQVPMLGPLTAVCLGAMHLSWGVGAIIGAMRYGFPADALVPVARRVLPLGSSRTTDRA